MRSYLSRIIRRYPLTAGLLLMFALTWPIDLGVAAQSHGWLPFQIPFAVPLLVGYGFVVASVVATGMIEGRAGISILLRRFLIWRVGPRWYMAVLAGPFALALAAVSIPFLLGGGHREDSGLHRLRIIASCRAPRLFACATRTCSMQRYI